MPHWSPQLNANDVRQELIMKARLTNCITLVLFCAMPFSVAAREFEPGGLAARALELLARPDGQFTLVSEASAGDRLVYELGECEAYLVVARVGGVPSAAIASGCDEPGVNCTAAVSVSGALAAARATGDDMGVVPPDVTLVDRAHCDYEWKITTTVSECPGQTGAVYPVDAKTGELGEVWGYIKSRCYR